MIIKTPVDDTSIMKLLIPFAAIASLALQVNAQALSPLWGQCGGQTWTGPTVCTPPHICNYLNQFCNFAMSSLSIIDSHYELNGVYNLSLHNHLDDDYHSHAYNDGSSFNQRYHRDIDFDYYGHYNHDQDYNYNPYEDADIDNHHN
ncbi:carbohydrate-binding module family 1 protein [Tulasnella calospora MUT 4182]|uniref:Carbohydrate-binding module family 1 protein n=1 Tax=Tulasnella calospora MUT 4182 TaxID=1051891 RepID=A0A0C3QB50_9AGAM|nr:carbohydrate-binding module family 1 protein [Tulasnella calospora MUT 4182]